MGRKTVAVAGGVVLAVGAVSLLHLRGRAIARWAWSRLAGGATVEERLSEYGPAARERLRPHFRSAGVNYPPAEVMLVGIKDVKRLEVWARNADEPCRLVVTYPVLAASGVLGPKMREGDRQVPEGLYEIESLHPNSLYHLALRVNYPNELDRKMAKAEGRSNLGGDIMIHGSNASVGCLAMGDRVAEELFVLVADTGISKASVIFTPVDFRVRELPADAPPLPAWTEQLYRQIRDRLSELRPPEPPAPAVKAAPGATHKRSTAQLVGVLWPRPRSDRLTFRGFFACPPPRLRVSSVHRRTTGPRRQFGNSGYRMIQTPTEHRQPQDQNKTAGSARCAPRHNTRRRRNSFGICPFNPVPSTLQAVMD